jgi:hypothetical protein
MHPVEPGTSNEIIFNGSGTLTGVVDPSFSSITGTFDLQGSIVAVGSQFVNSGTFTIESGATFNGGNEGVGSAMATASVIQKGGTSNITYMNMNAGTYELDGGTLSIGSTGEYIADAAGLTFTVTQKGGTHSIATFMDLGYQGTGTYDLQGGALTAAQEYFGQNGTGTFNQTGGTNTLSDRIVLGINLAGAGGAAGTGTYTLGGTGSLTVQTIFIGSDPGCTGTFNFNVNKADKATLSVSGTGGYPGLIVGGQGTGTFTQGAGTVSTTVAVEFRNTGVGTYNLNGGTLMSTDEEIGVVGTGTLIQQGGINAPTSKGLIVGAQAGSTGTYKLMAGTLKANSETIADSGTGFLTQDGGANTVTTGNLVVGNASGSNGTYTLNKGQVTVSAGNLTLGAQSGSLAIFNINAAAGATLTVTKGALTIGDAGTGSLTMGGGPVNAAAETIGNRGKGTFTQNAGNNTVTALDLIVGNGDGGDGIYTLGGASNLTISSGNLTVGAGPNSMGAFNFNTAAADAGTLTLTKGSITVGDGGTGVFTMGAGMLSSSLTLGSQVGGDGTFTLTGGALTATDVDEVIGDAGTGTFKQMAGTNTIDNGGLFLGNSNGGSGTYMLGGTGALKITSGTFEIAVGGKSTGTFDFNTQAGSKATISIDTKLIEVGVHGQGTFIQGAGTLGAKLVVGGQVGSNGTFELDGGTVSAKGQVVGNNGAGTFTINGAKSKDAITGNGDLILGAFAAGGGKFNLNNGTVTGGSELIGYAGAGTFVQKAGTNKLSGVAAILDLGVQVGSVGTYTLSGGTLSTTLQTVGDAGTGTFTERGKTTDTVNGKLIVGNNGGTGTFTLSGGSVTVKGTTASTTLGSGAKSTGTLTVTAARLTTPNLAIGAKGVGHVTVNAGGTIAVAKAVTIGSGSTLTLIKGALTIGTANAKAGAIVIGKGGSLTGAGSVTAAVFEAASGTLQAKGGLLTLAGAVGGGGTIAVADQATLDLAGKDANTVTFLGAAGTLKLEKTAAITGKIAQLQVGDVIDIAGTTITKAALSGSTLTLSKSGGGTIALTLTGSFTGDKFAVQSDGHGGSDIVLQKGSASPPSLPLFGQYVAAGFGRGEAGHGLEAPVVPPSVFHPDFAYGHG